MRMERIEPRPSWEQLVIIRLFRRWAAARSSEENAMVSTVELAQSMGESPMLAVALHSLMQLLEGHLGRALEPECCCSRSFSPDERALLQMIGAAPLHGQLFAPAAIPHGLPGALAWAAASLRQLMPGGALACDPVPQACPFARQG